MNYAIWSSPDGVTWTIRHSPTWDPLLPSIQGTDVVWANFTNGSVTPQEFAAAAGDSQNILSPDGITWTGVSPSSVAGGAVAAVPDGSNVGSNPGIIIGETTGAPGLVTLWESNDGSTWPTVATPMNRPLQVIDYLPGLGLWIASAFDIVWTSPDGVTWTFSPATITGIFKFATDGSRIVAVGSNGGFGSQRSTYSDDGGVTWHDAGLSSPANPVGIVYAAGIGFVAIDNFSDATYISPTGAAPWTAHTFVLDPSAQQIAWSPGLSLFVVVGSTISSSPDAITWTTRDADPNIVVVTSVTWSPPLSLFVAVGLAISGAGFIIGEIRMIP